MVDEGNFDMAISKNGLLVTLASLKFEPFTETDWDCFAGCESENPLIAFDEKTDTTYILDGDVLIVHSFDVTDLAGNGEEQIYKLSEV